MMLQCIGQYKVAAEIINRKTRVETAIAVLEPGLIELTFPTMVVCPICNEPVATRTTADLFNRKLIPHFYEVP
jgi:hypothetical protein